MSTETKAERSMLDALICPRTQTTLRYDADAQELISKFQNSTNNDKFKAGMKEYSQKILLDHVNYLNSFIK